MNLNPTGYYVLVEMEEVQQTTESGIILATAKEHEREQTGHDVGIIKGFGPLVYTSYKGIDDNLPAEERAAMYGVSIGDKVEFNRYDGKTPRHPDYSNFRIILDEHVIGRYYA